MNSRSESVSFVLLVMNWKFGLNEGLVWMNIDDSVMEVEWIFKSVLECS
jgi:hypothetical protein